MTKADLATWLKVEAVFSVAPVIFAQATLINIKSNAVKINFKNGTATALLLLTAPKDNGASLEWTPIPTSEPSAMLLAKPVMNKGQSIAKSSLLVQPLAQSGYRFKCPCLLGSNICL